MEALPDHSANVCVFANVLHELTPAAFSGAIHHALQKINADHGVLAALELYPLLVTEKFAW